MAGIPFRKLVNDFVATLERNGATVIRQRERDIERPAQMRVVTSDGTSDCLLFLWTVTPGGKNRPFNERRIQATGLKRRRIPLVPGFRTLLGGWNDETGVYSFWDPRRHVEFGLKESNSLQVTFETLEAAQHTGISTQIRPSMLGAEVVVAVTPDSLLWYVRNGLALHNSDQDAVGVSTLIDATPEDEAHFINESQDEGQTVRRYDLVELVRAFRQSSFRPAVLRAYRYQCAICRLALKLVDAAHIIPVSHPGSSDDITNGIALCRLHHGAYDNGLLGVQSNHRVVVNYEREAMLKQLNLHMGLEEFRNALPELITVPAQSEIRPNPRNLRVGLEARRFPADLVT